MLIMGDSVIYVLLNLFILWCLLIIGIYNLFVKIDICI